MKQILFFLAAGFTISVHAQTIRIADNNADRPTGANIFSTVQAAVDAAVPGDIVYVTPSLSQYAEDVVVGKQVTIQGVGFGITELGGRLSRIRRINLQRSTDGIIGVSGSIFKGIALDYFSFTTAGTGSFTFDNITIENVSFYQLGEQGGIPINNLTLKNSVFGGIYLNQTALKSILKIHNNRIGVDIYQRPISISNASDVLITNNLIYWHSPSVDIRASASVRFEHNIVSGTGQVFESLQNVLVINNIFFGMTPGCTNTSSVFRDNTFSNNLVTTSGFIMPPDANGGGTNSGTNNLPSGSNPLFINASVVTVAGATADTFNYTLQAGSPCIGAASTGENIGPSGGLYPWTGNLTLKPASMPVITLFGNSGVVPQNQPVKSNIKAKSN